MTWKVLIAHAKGEEALAEQLAEPLRQAGYEVVHRGTVLVGDSVVQEAANAMEAGGPLVLCGTVKAAGTKWARSLINAARAYERVKVFALKMEDEADVESLALGDVAAEYWRDPTQAMQQLLTALQKHYPLRDASPDAPLLLDAELRYQRLALAACDIIDLANLPESDRHLATRRLELRRLYVPLRVRLDVAATDEVDEEKLEILERKQADLRRLPHEANNSQRYPVGERLALARRLVVLGDPGAGKSTLLRWVATAYLLRLKQDPEWKDLPDVVTLPEEDWLPIIIRCRDLDAASLSGSLDDMLWRTLCKAELQEKEARALRTLLRDRLEQGRALLLVDGLDEIPTPSVRTRFCRQLEQIHLACPQAPIIVTSRIVGYREMHHRIGRGFEHVTVTDLSMAEKDEFARRWCALTVEPRERRDAATKELLEAIHSTDRIRRLTGNPMLLTTLALVKRKVGRLPRRRADLYSEAVQVLLNWRSEVDLPLDPAEALPQLEYIAYAMCERGVQRLRKSEVTDLLHRMREEYAQIHAVKAHSPEEFLTLLERRTGILMESGNVRHLGQMEPVFEFRHLTFQEYLAARALVEGRYPNRDRSRSLAEHIAPLAGILSASESYDDEPLVTENWRETLRLCIACCNDDDVNAALRAILHPLPGEDAAITSRPRAILASLCLADEPNVSDDVALELLSEVTKQIAIDSTLFPATSLHDALVELADSRWNKVLRQLLAEEFCKAEPSARTNLGLACRAATEVSARDTSFFTWLLIQATRLSSQNHLEAVEAALGLWFNEWEETPLITHNIACNVILKRLQSMLTPITSPAMAHAAIAALHEVTQASTPDAWTPTDTERQTLISALSDPNIDHESAPYLIAIVGNMGDTRAFEALASRLNDSHANVRRAAVRALGKLKTPIAFESTRNALTDKDLYVRNAAIFALGSTKDPRALDILLAISTLPDSTFETQDTSTLNLQNPEDRQILKQFPTLQTEVTWSRIAAVRALGTLQHPHAFEHLLKLLDADDFDTKHHAFMALADLGDPRAIEPLLLRLRDPSKIIQTAAAAALGKFKDPRIFEQLNAILNNSPELKRTATKTLGKLDDARARDLLLNLLGADFDTRHCALHGLSQAEDDVIARVLLSRDFNDKWPPLDPLDPIDEERILDAAYELGFLEAEVRSHYERIAQRIPLKLSWAPTTSMSSRAEPLS